MPTKEMIAEPSVVWDSVRIVAPGTLLSRLEDVHAAIQTRAYELCEARGRTPGEDWSDWFRAEAEFLRPVAVHVSESEDAITVIAQVPGFSAGELEIAVEPYRAAAGGSISDKSNCQNTCRIAGNRYPEGALSSVARLGRASWFEAEKALPGVAEDVREL